MMLAAVPPSMTMPWTRASGRSCWRQRPIELKSITSASSALRPFHGFGGGVRLRAGEVDVDVDARERLRLDVRAVTRVEEQGRVEPVEEAVVEHELLARPRSSAGVPRKTISPAEVRGATAASAIAAPTPLAAIVLWPQPWPSPGSASYSARTPMRGPLRCRAPPVKRPRTAVSSRPAGCSTA